MTDTSFDVAVVGAGPVGLAAALAFAQDGFSTCLVGPLAEARDGRTAALLDPSLRFLADLGLTDEIERESAPLRRLRLHDDTDSLFRPPSVTFAASEIGLGTFGRNIANATLTALLAAAARSQPNLHWRPEFATGLACGERARLSLGNDDAISASLVVGADGRASRVRSAAGIAVRARSYPQTAVTAILRHERDHEDTSTEFHTRSGPFTLVPLPGRRSSLVWVTSKHHAARLGGLDDLAFAEAVERQSQSLLGSLAVDRFRGAVPLATMSAGRLVAARVALVGEAAHVLPPIGAQGLNLGFADVATLLRTMRGARAVSADLGGDLALARFARARRLDVRVRSSAVDGLNRALLSEFGVVDALRGVGLGALAQIGPLRRLIMRAGLGLRPPPVRS